MLRNHHSTLHCRPTFKQEAKGLLDVLSRPTPLQQVCSIQHFPFLLSLPSYKCKVHTVYLREQKGAVKPSALSLSSLNWNQDKKLGNKQASQAPAFRRPRGYRELMCC